MVIVLDVTPWVLLGRAATVPPFDEPPALFVLLEHAAATMAAAAKTATVPAKRLIPVRFAVVMDLPLPCAQRSLWRHLRAATAVLRTAPASRRACAARPARRRGRAGRRRRARHRRTEAPGSTPVPGADARSWPPTSPTGGRTRGSPRPTRRPTGFPCRPGPCRRARRSTAPR